MTRHKSLILRLTAYSVLLGLLLTFAYFGPTSLRQARRMRVAESRLAEVNHRLAQDSRYAGKVKAQVYTGDGGSIMLNGTVATVEDYRSLVPYLDSLRVPVPFVTFITLEDGQPLPIRLDTR